MARARPPRPSLASPLAARRAARRAASARSRACAGPRPPAPRSAIARRRDRALRATVTHVVDGDTVDLALRRRRPTSGPGCSGIDTPETVKPDTPVECFGPEASARTKELLAARHRRAGPARPRGAGPLRPPARSTCGAPATACSSTGRSSPTGYARTLSIAPNTAHRADLAGRARPTARRPPGAGLWGDVPAGRAVTGDSVQAR